MRPKALQGRWVALQSTFDQIFQPKHHNQSLTKQLSWCCLNVTEAGVVGLGVELLVVHN
jgi:hypothetical protein